MFADDGIPYVEYAKDSAKEVVEQIHKFNKVVDNKLTLSNVEYYGSNSG